MGRYSRLVARWRLLFASVVIATLVVPFAYAAPVTAASGDSGTVSPTEVRSCPDRRCAVVKTVATSISVPVICWRDAGLAIGTYRWFRISYSGIQGYVSAARVSKQPTVPYCSTMLANETLWAGQKIWSPANGHRLEMQSDSNLVLYWRNSQTGKDQARWASRTVASGANRLVMQSDGNLVLYRTDPTTGQAKAVWATGTMGAGNTLSVQSDGNVVTYRSGTATWATSWHWTWGSTKTSNTGAAGNCTWYAYDRFKKFSGVYPYLSGDAYNWDNAATARGWLVRGVPSTQSIVVFEKYVQGSGSLGHVAWVDATRMQPDGQYVHVVEMNYRGLYVVSDRWVKHVSGMSYITAPQL